MREVPPLCVAQNFLHSETNGTDMNIVFPIPSTITAINLCHVFAAVGNKVAHTLLENNLRSSLANSFGARQIGWHTSISFLELHCHCCIDVTGSTIWFFFRISVAKLTRYWQNGDYIASQIFATHISRSKRWMERQERAGQKEKRRCELDAWCVMRAISRACLTLPTCTLH